MGRMLAWRMDSEGPIEAVFSRPKATSQALGRLEHRNAL
jgi:hypothetical protein